MPILRTTKDEKPSVFTSNPNNMSVVPAINVDEHFPKLDKSFAYICSKFIGRFPAIICVSMLILFLGLSVPYKDAPAKMAGQSNELIVKIK